LSKVQKPNESTKELIINVVKERKPKTISQLISFVQETTNLSEKQVIDILEQLEEENQLHFNLKQEIANASNKTYLFSIESAWYWTTMAVALATVLSVFAVPKDLFPVIYVRNFLGLIFVLFLPGYAFEKFLFQNRVPFKASSESFDTVERLVLSVGLSIALTPMMALILYYTQFGISLIPITLGLLTFTAIFATAAVAREYQAKSVVQGLNEIV
jgi:hypothetical protein